MYASAIKRFLNMFHFCPSLSEMTAPIASAKKEEMRTYNRIFMIRKVCEIALNVTRKLIFNNKNVKTDPCAPSRVACEISLQER